MATELNKWQKELQRIDDLARLTVNSNLFEIYNLMLKDIKKDVSKYIKNYDTLSFSKRLEVETQLTTAKQIEQIIIDKFSEVDSTVKEFAEQSAEHGYNGVWYALEGAENIQLGLPVLTENYIDTLLAMQINGMNFSQLLYTKRDKLAEEVAGALFYGVSNGKGYKEIAKRINELTEASYKQALRIAITEGGRIQSETTQKGYEESEKKGVSLEKEWLATLDAKTRTAHSHLDGQRVGVKEKFRAGGKTADGPRLFGDAGLDINCRCTTIPIVDGISPELRKDNETKEEIPFQSYEEWAKSKGIWKSDSSSSLKDLFNSIDMETASHRDIIELGKRISEEYNIKDFIGNKDKLVEIFSNFREMGAEISDELWAKGSKKSAKERLAEAFGYYPADWVEMLYLSGEKQIYANSSKRGFFSNYLVDGRGRLKADVEGALDYYFTICLDDSSSVAYHEIGHLVESLNEDILRIEKEFVESRTKGELETKLKDLFPGYGFRNDEVTKKDNFVDPYIGKTYKDATEVLSMGLEGLFMKTRYVQAVIDNQFVMKSIQDDEEFLNLIIGLIARG